MGEAKIFERITRPTLPGCGRTQAVPDIFLQDIRAFYKFQVEKGVCIGESVQLVFPLLSE